MATTLKIVEAWSVETVARVAEINASVLRLSARPIELAAYLDSIDFDEETDSVEDLRQWLPSLQCFDALLAELSQRIVTVSTAAGDDSCGSEGEGDQEIKPVLCSILVFLQGLLKRGKEKRCFLSYKVCLGALGLALHCIALHCIALRALPNVF